ncbi:hypothetical protein BT63DRAFT_183565 [Microthyrium microscopicum]|uniref:60S ribosomal subunit assembly/export protein loc1 n=1 Tax=Microthyrium microscopicum TaxID=703497 RepID=A0A6A6UKD7_9PEZI|nr:hypothetical protein BT63DRAFT_183565 [Microthyrium microscopicum]
MATSKSTSKASASKTAAGLGKPKSDKKTRAPKAKSEVKTHRISAKDKLKKKKRIYTAEELGVPKLNGIVPTGVQKLKGKKKGKVFVDDAESMLAILGMVQAEKEGEVEGKIMKARQLEEIREAKRVEAEKRVQSKKAVLEEAKGVLRQKKRTKRDKRDEKPTDDGKKESSHKKKRVSFG